MAARERLVAEYEVLGFSASGHPFTLLRTDLPPGIVRSDRLNTFDHGTAISIAGLVVARQRPETARGYTFVLLEDEAGMMNAVVRPDVYERDRVAVRGEPFLQVNGTISQDDGTVNIIAEEVLPLKVGRTGGPADGPSERAVHQPYGFLKNLRRHAPGSKNWA